MASYKISSPGKPDLIRDEKSVHTVIREFARDDNRADLWIMTLESKGVIVLTVKGIDITFKKMPVDN